jgi:hypothetical protein
MVVGAVSRRLLLLRLAAGLLWLSRRIAAGGAPADRGRMLI